MTGGDPLERALQKREAQRRANERAAEQQAKDSAVAAERHCKEQLAAARRLQHLGRSFLKRAGRLPTKKVHWSGCVEVPGRLGGNKTQRGGWVRAVVVEKSVYYSSSTGGSTSGTDLFVLPDGRILTGYADEAAIVDRLAAFLQP